MKLLFKSLMGSVPKARRTEQDVTSASMSIRKEDRHKLSTSERLKLSKSAREGGVDRFFFFKYNGKMVNEFRTVYNLHMQIEALVKALKLFDMRDVFTMIPE